MSKSALATILVILAPVFAGSSAIAEGASAAACRSEEVKVTGASCSRVATAQKPAIFQLRVDAKVGSALEITARPIEAEASPPYLVGVFVGDDSDRGAPKFLGSFSFYPERVGVAQTFILPKPEVRAAAKDLTLSIKLIPANPARDVRDAAVEILSARIVAE